MMDNAAQKHSGTPDAMPINIPASASGSLPGAVRGRARTSFALLIDPYSDWFNQSILRGVSDFARENGAHLICVAAQTREAACPLRDLLGPLSVDGVLVVTATLSSFIKDRADLAQFFERFKPLPCVSVGVTLDGVPSVEIDNRTGMSELLEHLVHAHRFRRIAFVRGPASNQCAQIRYEVYLDVLKRNQIPFDAELVVDGDWSPAAGADAIHVLKDVRSQKMDAVVCADDLIAAGAIEALHARGIRVPADVAVVGFDNDANVGFSLTTVHQPVYHLGRKAAAMLLDLVRGTKTAGSETLSTELIVRRSCGCFVADVTNSVAQTAVGSTQPPAALLARQREMTLTEMMRAARRYAVGVSPEWPERLFNAFVRDITGEAHGEFLSALDTILVQEWLEHQRIEPWQNVLSVLRRQLLPCLTTNEMFAEAENLWHQARVLVAEAAERMHAYQQELRTRQALRLMNVNATYFSKDIKSLADAFAQKLPGLGIDRCYAVVYEGAANTTPEWARLVLAYDEEEHIELEAGGLRFPAKQLIPEDFLPDYRSVTLWAADLEKDGRRLGAIFFEMGPNDVYLYETLRRQFSEPLSRLLPS
jgi:sigma-B regulation protein RsbU (phosphoserine phosphatase)